jgi:hypothetical protein
MESVSLITFATEYIFIKHSLLNWMIWNAVCRNRVYCFHQLCTLCVVGKEGNGRRLKRQIVRLRISSNIGTVYPDFWGCVRAGNYKTRAVKRANSELKQVTFLTTRTSTGSKVDVFHQSQPFDPVFWRYSCRSCCQKLKLTIINDRATCDGH